MAAVVNFILKGILVKKKHFAAIYSKTIMTSSSKLTEKALEELKNNPYYHKYVNKIAVVQDSSPEEFASKVEHNKQQIEPKFGGNSKRSYSPLLKPKTNITKEKKHEDQELNKIMKIELIRDKTSDEIKKIWEEYHLQKNVIAATIPTKDYQTMQSMSQTYPTFLFPIPRSQGYEFIMCQFLKNVIHFTPLLYYQVHKENAPECLTITHYTELQHTKGIVLMRGEYDSKIIDSKEAQCLANQVQLYYNQNDPEKTALLEIFTKNPLEFKHMDLVKQIESLTL